MLDFEMKRIEHRVEYYSKENECEYKWINSSDGNQVENAISVESLGKTYYIGRVLFMDSYHLGSVLLNYTYVYYNFNDETKSSSTYEVLTCEEKSAPKTPLASDPNETAQETTTEKLEEPKNITAEMFARLVKENMELRLKLEKCEEEKMNLH